MEPLLAQLKNRPALELHAYHASDVFDAVSERIRGHLKGWVPVSGLTNAQLASRIAADEVDILVDLSGHTALNRLPVFAQKPAPLQASFIGYPGTTGLRAMDYFFSDPHFMPPGEFDRHFTERLVYLPAQTPFQPHESAPEVNASPALATGRLTFGSFNRIEKINDWTIGSWSRLMRELPDTTLIIGGIRLESQRRRLMERFEECGITRQRLELHPPYDMRAYLALHHRVDICLDTSPYNGGTTTVHGLWMGVPTLTLAGCTPAARSGAAILGRIGLHEFIAKSCEEFCAAGVRWAERIAELAQLRADLRHRCRNSSARRADLIADALESALRHMWRRWCAGLPAETFATNNLESVTS
jgi:predicted O-linked N-acetylglucosamine transferase (SPINDLY family)